MAALQVQLDSISRPGANAAAEKIPILCPDRDAQHEGNCHDRPVFDIARGHSLPRELPEIPIESLIHRFDDEADLIEHRHASFRVVAAAGEQPRNVLASVVEANIRGVESDRILVGLQQRSDASAQHCADQDVRVEDDPSAWGHRRLAARHRLKSATSSSSVTPFAASSSSRRAAASLRAVRSVSERLRRAGMKYPIVSPCLVMATGASLSKRYEARFSRNSRMPTVTGSIDECSCAASVYRPVHIIAA